MNNFYMNSVNVPSWYNYGIQNETINEESVTNIAPQYYEDRLNHLTNFWLNYTKPR